jgi:hypothetical protein
MRYRYKPVFDGDELIAFAYWTGKNVQHYYIKKSLFRLYETPHAPTVKDEHVISSLDGITIKDYPQEVQTQVKQLRLGSESLTDDLPELKSITKLEQLREFVNWFCRRANEEYGKNIKLATWGSALTEI